MRKCKLILFILLFLFPCVVLGVEGISPTALDDLAVPVKIALALTVIPLIPFLLLTLTSFTRIIIVFSLLRGALATRGTPPNQVLIGLALFMTFYIMQPTFQKIYITAIQPYLNKEIGVDEAIKTGIEPVREFMLKEVREKDLALFVHLSGQAKPKTIKDVPTSTIIPAFITSELKTAFEMGFLIYLPFLIIDIVLASILLSMGMFMLPPMMISLPLKLLLFVLVDGWNLVVGSLVRSF